jgi:RES domain-containing protein
LGRGGLMLAWRLSSPEHAKRFDGGYGLAHPGRWNRAGVPVTYAASSPALCLLEKLVHVEDPQLMPVLQLVRYVIPDDLKIERVDVEGLRPDWIKEEGVTQEIGDRWHQNQRSAVLMVPSVVVPFQLSGDRNLVINNAHPDASRIAIAEVEDFTMDARLF